MALVAFTQRSRRAARHFAAKAQAGASVAEDGRCQFWTTGRSAARRAVPFYEREVDLLDLRALDECS